MSKKEIVVEQEIKDEELKEEPKQILDVKEDKKEKGSSKLLLTLLIIFIVIFITLIGIICYGFKTGKINFESKKETKENVDIKHTEVVTVKSDGVYITDVSNVVDEVMPAIVSITSKTIIISGKYGPYYGNSQYIAEGAGSGVIVDENDDEIFILTNNHVVEDTSELSVKFINDESYDATIKGISERKDVAIVAVKKSDLSEDTLAAIKIATLGESDELKVGNGIIAIGNALGYGQSVTTGVVSALNREVDIDDYARDMIQIDAAINGGNSGGALLNSKGEVVGINTAKYSSNGYTSSSSIEGMGFAIPISDVKPILESLIGGEDDTNNLTLGIEGYMTTNYRLPSGVYVTSILESSNAANSDLEVGNIIEEIDGKEVTSVDTIKKVIKQKNPGDTITLKISYATKKEYKEKEITITLN